MLTGSGSECGGAIQGSPAPKVGQSRQHIDGMASEGQHVLQIKALLQLNRSTLQTYMLVFCTLMIEPCFFLITASLKHLTAQPCREPLP